MTSHRGWARLLVVVVAVVAWFGACSRAEVPGAGGGADGWVDGGGLYVCDDGVCTPGETEDGAEAVVCLWEERICNEQNQCC